MNNTGSTRPNKQPRTNGSSVEGGVGFRLTSVSFPTGARWRHGEVASADHHLNKAVTPCRVPLAWHGFSE